MVVEEEVKPDLAVSEAEGERVARALRPSRIILPVLLGVAAVGFLFYKQFDLEQFRQIRWTGYSLLWIMAALGMLALRHFFAALRLRIITRKVFSWKKYIQLIVLWEFSGALTPSSKGGPLIMLFVLTKEKLQAGRTAATIFYSIIGDSGFFVVAVPLLLLWYGPKMLFPGMESYQDVGLASGAFFATYAAMVGYWAVLVSLLFLRPQLAARLLHWISGRRLLRRWSEKIERTGREFSLAAAEIRSQNWRYHAGVILSSIGIWTSKFFLINCLIIAIVPTISLDGATQAFIYARLVAMFVIMAFSPTPGGAGLAEVALVNFTSDYVPAGIALVVALLWRGMAYYGYLLAGAFVAPAWIAEKIRGAKNPG